MTVGELLEKTTSRELAEWEAYERATGPLGLGYITEVLAEMMDEIKLSNVMQSSKFEDSPYPVPERSHYRASEMYERVKQQRQQAEHRKHLNENPEEDPEVLTDPDQIAAQFDQ